MESYDIAVIGGGPIGSMAAKHAAIAGSEVIMLEEHASIGWPVECTGLLGEHAILESELSSRNFELQRIKGARVYSPSGHWFDFKSKDVRAWVVDRRRFDQAMALEALRSGVKLRLRARAKNVERIDGKSIVSLANGEKIRAKILISAEGVKGTIAKKKGIERPKKILSGAQVEVPFAINDPEIVEVHLGHAPGLFAWVVPCGKKFTRIGLCANENGCNYLRSFLKTNLIKDRLLGSPVALNVGGLPMGPPHITAVNGLLAVGDVVGHVKPTSGGGIYPGLIAAKIAGKVASSAAMEDDFSAKRLNDYDKLWRAAIGKELQIGMKINSILNRISYAELDEAVIYFASKPKLLRMIEEKGDIDRPSQLIAKMLPNMGFDGLWLARLLKYAIC